MACATVDPARRGVRESRMPPPLLIDLAKVDPDGVVVSRDEIYGRLLPQRHEFMLLDGVCTLDRDAKLIVAYSEVRTEDWWVRGHIPGRTLLPGVLMLEMAAQVSALGARLLADLQGFIGFGGVEACKFRETVVPPARLYILCVGKEYRPRRIVAHTQGVMEGKLVFEAKITGVSVR